MCVCVLRRSLCDYEMEKKKATLAGNNGGETNCNQAGQATLRKSGRGTSIFILGFTS